LSRLSRNGHSRALNTFCSLEIQQINSEEKRFCALIWSPCSDRDRKLESLVFRVIFISREKSDELVRSPKMLLSVIPAKVPRQARDPELVERAGIQEFREFLDPGFRRGDGLENFF
jgi:hypothetical protein